MSKVIRGPQLGSLERWRAPSLEGTRRRTGPNGQFSAAVQEQGQAQCEQELAAAREQGFAKGYQEGLQAAHEEMRANVRRLADITACARRPAQMLEQHLEDELTALAIAVARQVVRRELRMDPQQIAGVVKEARKALATVSGTLRIGLHPDDAPLVRRMFSEDEEMAGVQVLEDPSISRGGCTLATDTSFVDATVETRIARIAVQLLGDERMQPSAEVAPAEEAVAG